MIKTVKITMLLTAVLFLFSAFALAQPAKNRKTTPKPAAKKAPSATEIAESGSFVDGVYKNTLMGFSLTVPQGWELISDDINKAGLEASRSKVTAGRSQQMKSELNKSISRTRILFQSFRAGGGIGCGVETLSGPMTVANYVAQNKNFVLTTHAGARLTRDSYNKTIGGLVFRTFEVEIPKGQQLVKQTYHVTSRKNTMFFFVVTYWDDDLKDTLLESINTSQFGK